jgi:hypothetical protein
VKVSFLIHILLTSVEVNVHQLSNKLLLASDMPIGVALWIQLRLVVVDREHKAVDPADPLGLDLTVRMVTPCDPMGSPMEIFVKSKHTPPLVIPINYLLKN